MIDEIKILCPKCRSDQWAYEIGYIHPYKCRACEPTETRYTVADSYKAQLITALAEIKEKNCLLAELAEGLNDLQEQIERIQADRWNSLSVADRDRLIRDAAKD